MKIGHYVSVMAVQRGFGRNASGHIQIPMQAMKLLADAGHEVGLITGRFPDTHALHVDLDPRISLHLIDDPRTYRPMHAEQQIRRSTPPPNTHRRQIVPWTIWKIARQIIAIARREKFDVLHIYGHQRANLLGGLARVLGLPVPVVGTVLSAEFPQRPWWPIRYLWHKLDAVITATQHVQAQLQKIGVTAYRIRHGSVRDLRLPSATTEPPPRHRVVFWREATRKNGVDMAIHAFDQLAPRFPAIDFDFAVRPWIYEVPGLDELAARHANVHVHRFPYAPGVSLERLVAESLVVVLPFRELTIQPQLAIIESLAAGVPVVAAAVQSVPEMIEPGRNGDLVPAGDADALSAAIANLIADPMRCAAMGQQAADVAEQWNWDRFTDQVLRVYTELP